MLLMFLDRRLHRCGNHRKTQGDNLGTNHVLYLTRDLPAIKLDLNAGGIIWVQIMFYT